MGLRFSYFDDFWLFWSVLPKPLNDLGIQPRHLQMLSNINQNGRVKLLKMHNNHWRSYEKNKQNFRMSSETKCASLLSTPDTRWLCINSHINLRIQCRVTHSWLKDCRDWFKSKFVRLLQMMNEHVRNKYEFVWHSLTWKIKFYQSRLLRLT